MLIVEGPDGGGKTTLVKKLLGQGFRQAPRMSRSVTGPKPDVMELIERSLQMTDAEAAYQVWDRHALISEPVYGPLLRGGTRWGPGFDYLSAWGSFLGRHPTIIFCLPPLKTVLEGSQMDAQMPGVTAKIRAIYETYYTCYCQITFGSYGSADVVRYDWTKPWAPVVLQDVLASYKTRWGHLRKELA